MIRRALLALALVASPALAGKQVHVKTYVKTNGTVVQPHVRTAPNKSKVDNYSSWPNVNPGTGKAGTVKPWKPTAPKPR